MKKEEYYWLRPGTNKYHGKCEVCKKEFSVTWGCEYAIKKHSEGGKHKENIKLSQTSKKGLSSLFFCNVPTTVSTLPLLLLPMLLLDLLLHLVMSLSLLCPGLSLVLNAFCYHWFSCTKSDDDGPIGDFAGASHNCWVLHDLQNCQKPW